MTLSVALSVDITKMARRTRKGVCIYGHTHKHAIVKEREATFSFDPFEEAFMHHCWLFPSCIGNGIITNHFSCSLHLLHVLSYAYFVFYSPVFQKCVPGRPEVLHLSLFSVGKADYFLSSTC